MIDFGCGCDYLLKNIKCAGKIGIEINNETLEVARRNGTIVFKTVDEVENNWADAKSFIGVKEIK